ncbi:hypothetical protein QTP86_011288 [Hemibagrus guttatus]|nr:hypothetical protein QTP86_011288 [Hemibagrus guttatus]
MKVSHSKTEYMCVNEREGIGTVRLQGEEVKKVQEFKYLGSTVQSNGECGKEVKKRVQAGTPPGVLRRGRPPRARSGLVRVVEVEVLSEEWIQDIGGVHPRTLLEAVPLPVYEILKPRSNPPGVQKGTHLVCRGPLNV